MLMATKYGGKLTPNKTPQNRPIPGRDKDMQPNAAGGIAFNMDDVRRFQRWLILGSEANTHYESSDDLTKQNFDVLERLIAMRPEAVVPTIVDVRTNDMALRQSQALFALAFASANDATKTAAFDALQTICQTASQLQEFLAARKDVIGKAKSSRAIRTAVGKWYTDKPVEKLAYQLLKYRTRQGFSHADILELFHVKAQNVEQEQLFAWIAEQQLASAEKFEKAISKLEPTQQFLSRQKRMHTQDLAGRARRNIPMIDGFERLQAATDEAEAATIIREYGFTREMVPTNLLNSKVVWAALVEKMPYEALIRSLNKITQVGLIEMFGQNDWIKRITDPELIRKSRIHPMRLFVAWKQYQAGEGDKGSLTWTPNGKITGALEKAFMLSFANVEPSEKNVMVAIDVSGSMTSYGVAGIYNTMPWELGAALALVYLKANPKSALMLFNTSAQMVSEAHADMTLNEMIGVIKRHSGGGTDCAAPFQYIQKHNLPVDGVLMVTDSETWHGHQHVTQAKGSIRFFNVQTTASRASLNDPEDAGWYEVAGFSADTIKIAELFFAGRI